MNQAYDISKGSPERFGFQWETYNKILPIYEEQFKHWTILIDQNFWENKTFLDVGCGTGRNSYWPIKYGASQGVAIDVNEKSLLSARNNLGSVYNKICIEKTSAYEITYKDQFDIVFSIGVIHHLEFPETALSKMVQAAKPDGKVLIWVYGYENNEWIVKYFNPTRKVLFSKLPISIVHFISIFPAMFLWILIKLGFGKIGYFNLIRQFSFGHLRLVIFDQMLPCIANYWTKDEVYNLMKNAGLQNILLKQVNGMSWCALGTKVL